MKRTLSTLFAIIAIFCLTSCSSDEEKITELQGCTKRPTMIYIYHILLLTARKS